MAPKEEIPQWVSFGIQDPSRLRKNWCWTPILSMYSLRKDIIVHNCVSRKRLKTLFPHPARFKFRSKGGEKAISEF
jgi:hypothetical protein